MSMMAPSTDRWAVSCRADGEVSTAEARVPGLEIHLLGLPDGFSRDEVEGWIGSLAAASREGAVAASPDDPIPPVLRHVLGGLLFSHAELWGRSAGGPVSVVLVSEHGRVALGWVGDASARIYEDGRELTPEWVSVRDHQGRESRAWCGDARHDLRIELSCMPDSGSGPVVADLVADWSAGNPEAGSDSSAIPGEAAAARESIATLEHGTHAMTTEPVEGVRPARRELEASDLHIREEEAQGERPSRGVARWLSRALGFEKKPQAPASDASHAKIGGESLRHEAGVEAAGTTGEVVLESQASYLESTPGDRTPTSNLPGDASASSPPPESIISPRFEIAGDAAHSPTHVELTAVDIPLPPGVPDVIPPTPEPPSLTERAVRAAFNIEDPRAISLPGQAARAGAGTPAAREAAPAAPPAWTPGRERAPTVAPESEIRPVDLAAANADDPAEPREALAEGAMAHAGGRARSQPPRRPEWPEAPSTEPRISPNLARWAVGAGAVLLLFGAGWMVGQFQGGKTESKPSPLVGLLRRIGIAGARFETMVTSRPPGAAIVVDGKDSGQRAPATIEMSPGEHRVDLSFADLGSVSFMVKGAKGDKVPLDAALWGSVDVTVSDPSSPISVAVDGEARGFAPMTLDSLAPGPHELRFTGPGMASWGTTIEVRVGETREVLAYPLQSPATGLLQVRAVINQGGESQPLTGARVFVDGDPRGQTPLTLELPRGPHSVRVAHQQETGPVQVIDLPGGNQRFATFEFGLNLEYPTLALRAPASIPPDEPVLISATLGQVAAADVREMWLHVRTPDNRWRRYPMTLIEAQGSAVGAAPFPAVLLGPDGTTQYYVSALTSQGDEYFTEMQKVAAGRAKPAH